LTANELGLFLKQKVTDLSRNKQTPDYGQLREEGFDRGDFVFTIPSQATSPNVVPAGPQASVDEQVLSMFGLSNTQSRVVSQSE
jgi:hypothetical protein